MGELDLLTVCGVSDPFSTGTQYAMRTVFVTWLPLAIAGIVLVWRRHVHATMRGAAQLCVLAHLAIAVQVGAVAFPLLFLVGLMGPAWSDQWAWDEIVSVMVIGMVIVLPIAAISAAGIVAWHRVLAALASREGEGRMLV